MNFRDFQVSSKCSGRAFAAVPLFLLTLGASISVRAEVGDFNRRATAIAQILAGISPNPSDPALKRLVEGAKRLRNTSNG
jgi:hypothetical protein